MQKQLDETINKNPEKKQVIINSKLINIQSMEFHSLKKIGITVPPFKDECTLIFEGKFGGFSSHVHITIKCDNYLEVFNNLISWRTQFF
ncbi:hypothetical protein C5F47_03445 [Nitrosopumilus cobalaminigenes]|uniref:Uncharacterized protein n=1 Tax=Nitrosopumilus cobalaminigenes TaxID=1470066 RepID=A0A7D5RCX5_9ARCH|nr:hypothetical protein C5F47_03445 [Nitrosopumilus cobalaminigenes]